MIDPSEYEFAETLKATAVDKPVEANIKLVKRISTRYGDKRVLITNEETQVFLNALSLKALVDAFGEDETKWADKKIIIDTESSERTQGKKSIVIKTKL